MSQPSTNAANGDEQPPVEDSSLAAAVAAATESFINNIATTKDEETAAATAEKLSQETNTSEQQLVDEEQKMIAEQMEQEEKKDAPQEAEPAATTATATTSKPQQQKQKPKTNKLRKKDTKWMATYNELLEYRAKHGDCMIPRGWPLNPRLASWVAEQRKQYKLRTENRGTSITAERIALLDQIGFAWNAQQASWAGHLADLTAFRKKHGHCHVPMQDPDYPKLGLWVKEQRRHYTLRQQNKKTHMTPERIAALDAIDFCWDTHHATWMERLKELSEFKRDVGHTSVPTNYARNSKLATWVHHQRRQYKKFKAGEPAHITQDRIDQLNALGFNWTPRDEKASSAGAVDSAAHVGINNAVALPATTATNAITTTNNDNTTGQGALATSTATEAAVAAVSADATSATLAAAGSSNPNDMEADGSTAAALTIKMDDAPESVNDLDDGGRPSKRQKTGVSVEV